MSPRNAFKVRDAGVRVDELRDLSASRQYGLISRTSKAFCSNFPVESNTTTLSGQGLTPLPPAYPSGGTRDPAADITPGNEHTLAGEQLAT
jgi:hypothetical protein